MSYTKGPWVIDEGWRVLEGVKTLAAVNMAEKVARAIRVQVAKLNPGGFAEADVAKVAFEPAELEIARAAIEAMREPTEEMCRAGGENVFNERMGAFPEKDAEEAANIFRTMINAALK